MTNVKNYTTQQILDRVKLVGGSINNKGRFLIVGVQSTEDQPDVFDDKFYVFDQGKFVMVTTGTTNPGLMALKGFASKGLKGAAIWKTDVFYEGLYEPGMHRGRMKALRQIKPIVFYRDSDGDERSEEHGKEYKDIIYVNFHGVSYDPFSKKVSSRIGGWSYGCQVCNRMSDYRAIIKATWDRNIPVDYCLLKEW